MVRCREGRVDGNGAACMFPPSRETYTGHVIRQFGMIQEIPCDVDTDTVLHKIDLRGKVGVHWMRKHAVHVMEWGNRLQWHCEAMLGDMPPQYEYFN